jgi:mRNA-degrading endonuclease toxin of MazEF toxin-antitoxin module
MLMQVIPAGENEGRTSYIHGEGQLFMGHFVRGDVIIAQVQCFGRSGAKLRPAVVVGTGLNNELLVVPVSSQPSTDSPSIPLSLDDFLEGGLDMFNESYILYSHVSTIPPGSVVGKRGRLTSEYTDLVLARVTPGTKKKNRK